MAGALTPEIASPAQLVVHQRKHGVQRSGVLPGPLLEEFADFGPESAATGSGITTFVGGDYDVAEGRSSDFWGDTIRFASELRAFFTYFPS